MTPLIIGSRNLHKLEEIKSLLKHLPLDLNALPDSLPECEEDLLTFRGNAEKKALEYAQATQSLVLADDSGLVVPMLDGAPGVHSARFAGEPRSHERNNRLLLERLKGKRGVDRCAYFTCVMVLADPQGVLLCVDGRINGRIAYKESGTSGFGYDPLFVIDEPSPNRGVTMAEVDMATKNSMSHRGRALAKLVAALPSVLCI